MVDFYSPELGEKSFLLGGSKLIMWRDVSGTPIRQALKANLGKHPIELFLKAHILGQRVDRITSEEGEVMILVMKPSGNELRLKQDPSHELNVEVRVVGMKPFVKHVPLADYQENSEESALKTEQDLAKATDKLKSRQDKLVEKIQNDIAGGDEWLAKWTPAFQDLSSDPSARSWDRWAARPDFRAEFKNRDDFFDSRRRAERKIAGGKRRLAEVKSKPLAEKTRAQVITKSSPELSSSKPDQRPRTKPGFWVSARDYWPDAPELWARVGRNSPENAELFRQSKDRDLWFHVRGMSGSHVWIPRGQPEFGAKDDPGDWHYRLGCQLALLNSKMRRAASGPVDVTERRHLKAISGSQGELRIERSETRHTKLDPVFEKSLMS